MSDRITVSLNSGSIIGQNRKTFIERGPMGPPGESSPGGSFDGTASYLTLTNRQIIVPDVELGDVVNFTKPNNTTLVDRITDTVHITRGNARSIFNILEDRLYPLGTGWNSDGWDDLTDLADRDYGGFDFAAKSRLDGSTIIGTEFIFRDNVSEDYWKLIFTSYDEESYSMEYTRTPIDPITGEDIGEPVTFTRGSDDEFGDEVNERIILNRTPYDTFYNELLIYEEGEYDSDLQPSGTLWNTDGWSNLNDARERVYRPFLDTLNNVGEEILDPDFILYIPSENSYYTVKFTQWTQGGNGGGFSYTRTKLSFPYEKIRETGDNEFFDTISDGVVFEKNNSDVFLYNSVVEENFDSDTSPANTLWNADGWNDLTDVEDRTFVPFKELLDYWLDQSNIVGREFVFLDQTTDKYWALKVLSYGTPDIRYERYEINPEQEGIRFADGTLQKTAVTDVVSSRFGGNILIENRKGYSEVSVTSVISNQTEATILDNRTDSSTIYFIYTQEIRDIYDQNYDSHAVVINGTTYEGDFSGFSLNNFLSFSVEENVTVQANDVVTLIYRTGGVPAQWLEFTDIGFKGAIVDYYAVMPDDVIIGTVYMARNTFNGTEFDHIESYSGYTGRDNISFWHKRFGNETRLFFKVNTGNAESAKINWTAKVFIDTEND